MRAVAVMTALLLGACGTGTDDAAVTTAPPVSVVDVSTTSTSPIETTTTTVATTTTTVATTTTLPAGTIVVDVVGGEVTVTGVTTVAEGDAVTLRVQSDVADRVVIATYELEVEVAPESPAVIEFVADTPGVHEVELEDAGLLLLSLEVGG